MFLFTNPIFNFHFPEKHSTQKKYFMKNIKRRGSKKNEQIINYLLITGYIKDYISLIR